MNTTAVSRFLIEDDRGGYPPGKPDSPKVFADRLLLRIYEYPSLLAALQDIRVIGNEHVELVFERFPEEDIESVKNLIGVDPDDIEVMTFPEEKGHEMRVAFRARVPEVRPEDMVSR